MRHGFNGLGRFPGGGNGNPFQDSCQENPLVRGVYRVQSAFPILQANLLLYSRNIPNLSPSGRQIWDWFSHLLAWLSCEKTLSLLQIWHLSFWLAAFWVNESGLLTWPYHHASELSDLLWWGLKDIYIFKEEKLALIFHFL